MEVMLTLFVLCIPPPSTPPPYGLGFSTRFWRIVYLQKTMLHAWDSYPIWIKKIDGSNVNVSTVIRRHSYRHRWMWNRHSHFITSFRKIYVFSLCVMGWSTKATTRELLYLLYMKNYERIRDIDKLYTCSLKKVWCLIMAIQDAIIAEYMYVPYVFLSATLASFLHKIPRRKCMYIYLSCNFRFICLLA